MNKRTRRGMIAALVLAGLAITGCAASAEAKAGAGNTVARAVDLPDGRQVLCVFWVPVDNTGVATPQGAQISCDWVGAK